jgi:hypothetical protein
LLNSRLALVSGALDQRIDIPRIQMGREHADRGEMKPGLGERAKELRKPASSFRRLNAFVSRVLGKTQLFQTIGEHRRIAG